MKKKKNIILALALFILIILLFMFGHDRQTTTKTNGEWIYTANTNFPVIFEDGGWTEDLKEFTLKDLNSLFANMSAEIIDINNKKVSFVLSGKHINANKRLKFSNWYIPSYVDSAFSANFGYICSVNRQSLIIPAETMTLYEEIYNKYKTQPKIYNDLDIFCNNVLPNLRTMNKSEISSYVRYINEYNTSVNFSDIPEKDVKDFAKDISNMFSSENYSYSWLYICNINDDKENITDDFRLRFSDISHYIDLNFYDNTQEPYRRNQNVILVYSNDQWKYLVAIGGE
jgi:hypothetical protein